MRRLALLIAALVTTYYATILPAGLTPAEIARALLLVYGAVALDALLVIELVRWFTRHLDPHNPWL